MWPIGCASAAAVLQPVLSLIALLVVQVHSKGRNSVRDDRAVPFERSLSFTDCNWGAHHLTPDTPLEWEAQAAIIHIGHSTTHGETPESQICAAINCVCCHHQAFSTGTRSRVVISLLLKPPLPSAVVTPCKECLTLLSTAIGPQHQVMRLTVAVCFAMHT